MPSTLEERRQALAMVAGAILATVEESEPHGAPSGVMFAACQSMGVSLKLYQSIIDQLVKMGKIKVENHLVRLA